MTRASDLTDVGQGLAAGCLYTGAVGVMSGKQTLDFSFRRAWRSWPRARWFPAVRADFHRNDISTTLGKADGRRGAYVATWLQDGPWWRPSLRHAFDLDDAAVLLSNDHVAWSDWVDLASLFLSEMNVNEVDRS